MLVLDLSHCVMPSTGYDVTGKLPVDAGAMLLDFPVS
jgi:hypothetical protein